MSSTTLLLEICRRKGIKKSNRTYGNSLSPYLLGAELLGSGQVLSIVVAQVVVTGNGHRLDASSHQEVHQHALDLRLTGLEVVAGNEDLLLLGQLNESGHKGVLRRAIDVCALRDKRNIGCGLSRKSSKSVLQIPMNRFLECQLRYGLALT